MKFCLNKEIKRLKCVIGKLFNKKEFDFNKEDSLNYAFFHENGLFSKTENIKKLIRSHYNGNSFSGNSGPLLLDICCGTGEIDEVISSDFRRIIGMDSAVEAVKKAKARDIVNSNFLVCNAEKLCFLNGLFDVVILVNCLHHSFKSIRVIIQEAHRVLKKGGLIVVSELNPLNPLQIIWFYLFCPIDRGMCMISPGYLKEVTEEVTNDNGLITIKLLRSSLYFEYMAVCLKK
jgi:ubiquinone/menaquinone biosynthesis C-methylase UbiE